MCKIGGQNVRLGEREEINGWLASRLLCGLVVSESVTNTYGDGSQREDTSMLVSRCVRLENSG